MSGSHHEAFVSPWGRWGLVKTSVTHQGSYTAAGEQRSQRRPDLEMIHRVHFLPDI